jgi:hypothetical protein
MFSDSMALGPGGGGAVFSQWKTGAAGGRQAETSSSNKFAVLDSDRFVFHQFQLRGFNYLFSSLNHTSEDNEEMDVSSFGLHKELLLLKMVVFRCPRAV